MDNFNNNDDINNEERDKVEDLEKLNYIINAKKRQCSISFSQRMLKKADNLTRFNKKNHSEGNKHITNADL